MAGKCPMCKKPEAAQFKPFCSKRCADIDLGRWLKEGYAIKGQDGDAMLPANDRDDGGDL